MPAADKRLSYSQLPGRYAICRFRSGDRVPDWALGQGEFSSVTRTKDELSIVCPEQQVPGTIQGQAGWICFKLQGPLDFAQTGILAAFLSPLSAAGIPILAIATWDTDYVMVKEEFKVMAVAALEQAGHQFTSGSA